MERNRFHLQIRSQGGERIMNKKEFLSELQGFLHGLPEKDVLQWLSYYEEMIDERIEEGVNEEDAVSAMGTPREIATKIASELNVVLSPIAEKKPKRTLRAWQITAIIIGSPIWISLLAVVVALAVAVCAVIVALVVAVCAVVVGFGAGGIGGIICSVILFAQGNVGGGILSVGSALVLAGFALISYCACIRFLKGFALAMKKFWARAKRR